ncbi:MAG: sirohydrochlorin chelatase [Betaproteobacteria bacterium]
MDEAALILFGHGARDPEWASPMRRVRETILAISPGRRVELAFLEFMAPTLPECVATLAQGGVTTMTVIPMFIAQGGHLKRDVPELIETLKRRHPGIELRLTPAVGEADAVLEAMARYALQQ